MRVIVLSKNRPAQLDQTLRSLYANLVERERLSISVWYCFDNEEFARGYRLVQRYHPSVHFELQRHGYSIKEQLLSLIEMKEAEFASLFVDDLVVIRPFSLTDRPFSLLRKRPEVCGLSLRLNPRVNYSQPLSLSTPPPPLDKNNTWKWAPKNIWLERFLKVCGVSPATGDWRLQLTPDGNVHRYRDFRDYFRSLPELSHINKLEWQGLLTPMNGSRLVCYEKSKVIVAAMNSVDPLSKYPAGNSSPTDLNSEFLTGRRLDYERFAELDRQCCHIVAEPAWSAAPEARAVEVAERKCALS